MSNKYVAIALGALYFFWWLDLIPDRLGLIGRIDDLLVIVFIYLKYIKSTRLSTPDSEKEETSAAPDGSSKTEDPYEILNISRSASSEEIEATYKKLMTQYHPDKVNHLGEDLKKLAHEKSIRITWAYETLKNRDSE